MFACDRCEHTASARSLDGSGFQSIDVSWSGHQITQPSSLPILLGDVTHGPAEMARKRVDGTLKWDAGNGRLRMEASQFKLGRNNKWAPFVHVTVYDRGFTDYVFQSFDHRLGRPPLVFHSDRKDLSSTLEVHECLPFRLVYAAPERIAGMYSNPKYENVGSQVVDGRRCVHFVMTANSSMRRLVRERYWLDEQRSFLPVQFEKWIDSKAIGEGGNSRLVVRSKINYRQADGQPVPSSWSTAFLFRPDGTPGVVLEASAIELTLNGLLTPSDFKVGDSPSDLTVLNRRKSGSSVDGDNRL